MKKCLILFSFLELVLSTICDSGMMTFFI